MEIKGNRKPIVGITVGDFNGIGPEIIIKTLQDNRMSRFCTPVVYGSSKVNSRYRKLLGIEDVSFNLIREANQANIKRANVINCWEDDLEISPGKETQEAGRCAFLALKRATEDLKKGEIDVIVTAPINKKNIQSSDFNFPGHTEYFASHFSAKDHLMLLCSDKLRVGIATGHIPISQISASLTKEKINTKLTILHDTLKKDFMVTKPKIAILGLNPHSGENGLIGNEEINTLVPLVEEWRNKGKLLFGPYAADGFFGMMQYQKFDGVLALYHDQGLIPFKTLAFETGVNYTAGLSIIRTSPDHGTAYDIAGKGIANESALRAAIFQAIEIHTNRKEVKSTENQPQPTV